ncbi:lymphocyte antigen 6G6e-like isoform X1 [Apodemus sylvaticus]|uniref:lymphocyte antigen 6G6e-like isoform X1 n=1 Tax=Apodemus sylvaticus TaxID=10129 RepID=UPI002242EBEA|nr:lymphocyte antigen 6G6e-like isoform X1 [Apodemus sylvaticus]
MAFSLLCVSALRVSQRLGFAAYLLPALISADPTGLTTSPTRGRLHCYACSFAKPCYPVPTECREDEVCGVSVGTSEQKEEEVIERKGCLPRAQCPLLGRATYWSRSYALRHQCCEQDLCNAAASQRPPSLPLVTLLPLAAMMGWGAHVFL